MLAGEALPMAPEALTHVAIHRSDATASRVTRGLRAVPNQRKRRVAVRTELAHAVTHV